MPGLTNSKTLVVLEVLVEKGSRVNLILGHAWQKLLLRGGIKSLFCLMRLYLGSDGCPKCRCHVSFMDVDVAKDLTDMSA